MEMGFILCCVVRISFIYLIVPHFDNCLGLFLFQVVSISLYTGFFIWVCLLSLGYHKYGFFFFLAVESPFC